MNNDSINLRFQNQICSITQIRKKLGAELDNLEQELLAAETICRHNPDSNYSSQLPALRQKVKEASERYFQRWGEIYRQQLA